MKLLIALFALIPCLIRAEALGVATLANNEKIVVTYSSSGCFHFFTKIYTLSGGVRKRFEAAELEQKWNDEKKTMEPQDTHPLGTVFLTESEQAGLDDLLKFYRSRPSGGCTTVDRIAITYWRGNEKVGEESFTDATCSHGAEWGAVHFSQIEKRFGP